MTIRKKDKIVRIGDSLVQVVTVSGFAQILGKSRDTVLRYERTGVFPNAFIEIRGSRYYPKTLADRLVPVVRSFPLHCKIPQELIAEVNLIFKEERERYATKET